MENAENKSTLKALDEISRVSSLFLPPKEIPFSRFSLTKENPYFSAIRKGSKSGGTNNTGDLKGVYTIPSTSRDEVEAIVKTDIPAMVISELVGSALYSHLLPNQSAKCDLLVSQYDPNHVYVISYFHPHTIANGHELAGYRDRPKFAFLFDSSLRVIDYILTANDRIANHTLERVLAASLRLDDIDIQSGNIILVRIGNEFVWVKIDHSFAAYHLQNHIIPHSGVTGYFIIPLISFNGKQGAPSTQPSSHFVDWSKSEFYQSPYFAQALYEQSLIPGKRLKNPIKNALIQAQLAYEKLGQNRVIKKQVETQTYNKNKALYQAQLSINKLLADLQTMDNTQDLLSYRQRLYWACNRYNEQISLLSSTLLNNNLKAETISLQTNISQATESPEDTSLLMDLSQTFDISIDISPPESPFPFHDTDNFLKEFFQENSLEQLEFDYHLAYLKLIQEKLWPILHGNTLDEKNSQTIQDIRELLRANALKFQEDFSHICMLKKEELVQREGKKFAFKALYAYAKQVEVPGIASLKIKTNDSTINIHIKIKKLISIITKEIIKKQEGKRQNFAIQAKILLKEHQEKTRLFFRALNDIHLAVQGETDGQSEMYEKVAQGTAEEQLPVFQTLQRRAPKQLALKAFSDSMRKDHFVRQSSSKVRTLYSSLEKLNQFESLDAPTLDQDFSLNNFVKLLVEFHRFLGKKRPAIFNEIQKIESRYPKLFTGFRRVLRQCFPFLPVLGKTERLFFNVKRHLSDSSSEISLHSEPPFITKLTPQLLAEATSEEASPKQLAKNVRTVYQKEYDTLIQKMIGYYEILGDLENKQKKKSTFSPQAFRLKTETEIALMEACYEAIQLNALLNQESLIGLDKAALLTVNQKNIYSDDFLHTELEDNPYLPPPKTWFFVERVKRFFIAAWQKLTHWISPPVTPAPVPEPIEKEAYCQAKKLLQEKILPAAPTSSVNKEKFFLMRERYAKSTTYKLVQDQEALQRTYSCGFTLPRALQEKLHEQIQYLEHKMREAFLWENKPFAEYHSILLIIRQRAIHGQLCLISPDNENHFYLSALSFSPRQAIDFQKKQKDHIFTQPLSRDSTQRLIDEIIANIKQQAQAGPPKINGMPIEKSFFLSYRP